MKDTVNNKKGFTMVEILAVIALVGIVVMVVVPNVANIFSKSVDGTMKVQENEIASAALYYLEDTCKNPLPGEVCILQRNSEDYTFSGTIGLNVLIEKDYIDTIKLQKDVCTGYVVFSKNKPTAYLACPSDCSRYHTDGYNGC